MAVVANKFFGNPFVSFHKSSDFNADSRFIGYFCAGMFLFSEAHWILKENYNTGRTIHFISRDGYLIKEAYDKLRNSKCYQGGGKIKLFVLLKESNCTTVYGRTGRAF